MMAWPGILLSKIVLALLWAYRKGLSPFLPPSCRYSPSCSEYAQQAVRQFGPFRGSFLAIKRVLRCHPWSAGGYDPVPQDEPKGTPDHG